MTSDSLSLIHERINDSLNVKRRLLEDHVALEGVARLAEHCLQALRNGRKVLFAGNGGSFADAQHLAAEFVSRFMFDREPLSSLALGTNNSCMSAIGNDYGYDKVFERELRAVGSTGDIFVGITTSGNSPNILSAARAAKELGLITIGLTGATGGKLTEICDCICVPSTETARIQESHILIGHILCEIVEHRYFKEKR